ncbi:helix-turn-helix domain-containing protein [Chromobacterium haemolyticum]|uniref:Helix-turn-helix domain-containing protein n=1 Tax=Chromobacterium haemolyticum TaxID=394935 RepID=A0A1W0CE24_9NEIS|nr:helix-turn-helix domain-containing protein [Chromobacterium haemolyticum]OQS32943.1 hypothetical protein B0T45_20905 [Chromobacterium haemolyticum]
MDDLFPSSEAEITPASADATWFHIFRQMFDSGDVAKMKPHAFTVYSAIKCHVNFNTGEAFPGVETLATMTGISERQVIRELASLEALGYLTKRRVGRKNMYTLREKVQVLNLNGRPIAEATWDYLPATVKAATAELKHYTQTGETGTVINIEHLVIQNLNVINGNTGEVNMTNIAGNVREGEMQKMRDIIRSKEGKPKKK